MNVMAMAMLGTVFILSTIIAASVATPISVATGDDVCHLGPIQEGKTNACYALKLRYWFNAALGQCQTFNYGGCFGSANLFTSREQCEYTCGTHVRVARASQIKPSKCGQPKKDGMCGAHISRFYYHKKSNKCRKFIYGGCGGNDNNFRTITECRTACNADPFD